MPLIQADKSFEQFVIDTILKNYQTREGRDGKWHVSDLMFPRYAVFSRKYNRIPTREDIGFFLTGEAYHEFLQKLLGERDSEVRGELYDVLGTADYFDGSTLLEIKTSRKWTVPDKPQDHYVEQAGYYCAIFGKSVARILVIYPTAGRKWDGSASSTVEAQAWNISFSADEISGIKDRMKELTTLLDKARESGKVDSLPACPEWKYGSIERDKEKQEYFMKVRCPFAEECGHPCSDPLDEELERKNANRRKPKVEKGLASRYTK